MTEATLLSIADSLGKKIVMKPVIGCGNVAMIGQTQIAYDAIDENGKKYLETDYSKFPSSCTRKHILDCIEANTVNLGKIAVGV